VPGADVTATRRETNATFKDVTNNVGAYQLLYLLPGTYTVKVEKTGFQTTVQENVGIDINARVRVDFTLQVGAVTQQVQVTAGAPLLQTATANVGQTFGARDVSALPMAGGSIYEATMFTTGTSQVGNMISMNDQNRWMLGGGMISWLGTPSGTSNFTVDGVNNAQMIHGQGPAETPPVDIVQEMKIETAFDASSGNTSGVVVNVALKSGTNKLHGSGEFYDRPPYWASRPYFSTISNAPRGNSFYKRWGGTFTGPVYLPKIYNGSNRTFFTYAYQADIEGFTQANITTVPTQAERQGDFSALLKVSSAYQIYDPATIQPAGNGRYSRQPFAGNIIPSNRISPIAAAILPHYTLPNQPGAADGSNNWSYTSPNIQGPSKFHDHLAKIDHNFTDKQRLSGRFTYNMVTTGPYRQYWDDLAVGENYGSYAHLGSLDYTNALSSSLVFDGGVAHTRYVATHVPPRKGFDVASLGFPTSTVALLQRNIKVFPALTVSGLQTIGNEAPDLITEDMADYFARFNKERGGHNLKFGTDIFHTNYNYFSPGSAGGSFTFGCTYDNGPLDNSPCAPSGGLGQGTAALLLGLPTGGATTIPASSMERTTTWAFYLHDNWRASKKLTVDAGLRWEYWGPYIERWDRSVRGFNPTASLPIAAAAGAAYAASPDPSLAVSQFKVQGGLRYEGVGTPNTEWSTPVHGILEPRFGFAYQAIPNRLVLRGGYGLFAFQPAFLDYQTQQVHAIQTGYSQATSIVPTNNNGMTFVANLANPWPSGLIQPVGNSLGAATNLGTSISFFNPNQPTSYTQMWNFNMQWMLPGKFFLEVGYTGDHSIKLEIPRNMDALPNSYLSTSPTRDQTTINYLTANIANPFAGLVSGQPLNTATISRSQLLVPYAQFTGMTMNDPQGYSRYNALQVRVERRLGRGVSGLAAYTWSKAIDATQIQSSNEGHSSGNNYQNPADNVPTENISGYDKPQEISMAAIWELPFGQGKALFGGIDRLENEIIGGWRLSGTWYISSGTPAGVWGDDLLQPGMTLKDVHLSASQRTVNHWFNTSAFVTAASAQLADNFRTFPLRFSQVRSGSYNDTDLALEKNFFIKESHHFQVRFEAYNAFNHPSAWDAPDTTPTDSTFGRMTNTYCLYRELQFGLKYLF
jgi:hypothetical protein